MIEWARAQFDSPVSIDFFAVSLPSLIVFDSDLKSGHQHHCLFVEALGLLGLTIIKKQTLKGQKSFEMTMNNLISLSPAHEKANLFKKLPSTFIYLKD